MTDFFSLSSNETMEALNAAASHSGRPAHLLEKDVWVVWTLRHLFTGPHAPHLVFKGGTSLSKAYGVINRFSEDIDLTYDIRAIAPDLIGNADHPLPDSKSQEKNGVKEIRSRLSEWVSCDFAPGLRQALLEQSLPALIRTESDKVFIDYVSNTAGTGYVAPTVILEFGARSTGEPSAPCFIRCDAADYLPMLTFPEVTAAVMRAERTFWEKATAIHVFCAQGSYRGGTRFARHWHDIARLDATGFVDAAIADRALGSAVAAHKSIFFSEKNRDGKLIDYHAAIAGELQLVPENETLAILAADYQHMIDDGLLMDGTETFELLMQRCEIIQQKTNTALFDAKTKSSSLSDIT